MSLRIVDSGVRPAHWNIAETARLFEEAARGVTHDTLRFNRYQRCILLGRNQDAARELDIAHLTARGVSVAHRITGGLAVAMHAGVLAWDYVTRRPLPLAALTSSVNDRIAAALTHLGVPVRIAADGDLMAGSRKIGGCAGIFAGRAQLLQGMIFLDVDRRGIAGLLRRQSATRLAGIRIAGLDDVLSRRVEAHEVITAVAAQFATDERAAA